MTRVPITSLNGYGLVRDMYAPQIPPEAWSSLQNARLDERGISSFPGHEKVFSQALVSPLWYKQFPPTDVPYWIYTTLTDAYVYYDGSHYTLTRNSGAYTATAAERWMGDLFSGLGIFNNTQDVPQMWGPMNASTLFADLSNWPAAYRCKFIRPFGNFLIAGNIYDGTTQHPFRLKWSHPASPGAVPISWDNTDPSYDAGERDLGRTSDELVDGLPLGELFIVYRENTTWLMRYVGYPDIFATAQLTGDHGIMTRDCAVDTPKGHIVATREDIVAHQGTADSIVSLLSGRDRRWLFSQINSTYWYNCFMVRNSLAKEVWFCFPESGATYATMAFVMSLQGYGPGIRTLPGVPFVTSGSIGSQIIDDTG